MAKIIPVVTPWGRFGLYSFLIDTPEPAIVDTGVAGSVEAIAEAMAAAGRDLNELRWILLTHGHIDHIGGAAALKEATGGRAKVVIGAADADLLRSRDAHVRDYVLGRGRYVGDPDGQAREAAETRSAISGELEPDVQLLGGEVLDLGGGALVRVHPLPGHTAGSVAYEVDGSVFVGDGVQVHGAANGFPGFADPDAYRESLLRLRDDVRPERLYLGHPYRASDGTPFGVELDSAEARLALDESIALEARVRELAGRFPPAEGDSSHAPFQPIADALGYTGDPRLAPSPFFTTCHGYLSHA